MSVTYHLPFTTLNMLKQTIISDLTAAMKAKETLKLGVLRMLKADIMKFEVSGANKEATDEVVADLIKRGIKQRKEAIEGFEKGGNMSAAENERAEIEILEKYLPEQMSEEAVKAIAKEVVAEMSLNLGDPSASVGASFGKVMGAVMAKVKGKADGNVVSKAVKEILG